jgi:AsmA protein
MTLSIRRPLLLAAAGAGALLVLVVGLAIATFDAERFVPQLAAWVKDRTGRELAVDGPIHVSLFPSLGVAAGRMTLSSPGGKEPFASVAGARLSLALWPLLRGDVVVDDVLLDALALDLVTRDDGTTNFDDFVSQRPATPSDGEARPGGGPGRAARVAPSTLELRDAEIRWRDRRHGNELRLHDLQARFGRLGPGAAGDATVRTRVTGAKPSLDLGVEASGAYRLERGVVNVDGLVARARGKAGGLEQVDARLEGSVAAGGRPFVIALAGMTIDARAGDAVALTVRIPSLRLAAEGGASEPAELALRLTGGGGRLDVGLAFSALRAEGERIVFERVAFDGEAKRGDATYELRVAGPLVLDPKRAQGELPALSGTLQMTDAAVAREPVTGTIAGRLSGAWTDALSARAALTAQVDGATLEVSLDAEDIARERFTFDVAADRLDLDRYLAPPSPTGAAHGGGQTAGPPAVGGTSKDARSLLDFERLARLDFSGSVRVGSLVVRGIRAERVNAVLRNHDGRFEAPSFAAVVYGGTTSGDARIDLHARRWHLSQQLNGVQAGPLLRALASGDRIEGRTTAALALDAHGETGEALLRSLSGTARFAVTDGAIKGIDVAEMLRQANVVLGSKTSLDREARPGDRTSFAELAASFVLKDGVATTRDLAFRSDVVKAAGGGRVDLASGAIDYRLDTTLVGVSADIRNRFIARIGEVAIPVRVTGTIAAPKYSVDVGGLAAAAAANEAARQLQRGGEGRKDPIGDVLRGLFRKQ